MKKIPLYTDQSNSSVKEYVLAVKRGLQKLKDHRNNKHVKKVEGCVFCHFL